MLQVPGELLSAVESVATEATSVLDVSLLLCNRLALLGGPGLDVVVHGDGVGGGRDDVVLPRAPLAVLVMLTQTLVRIEALLTGLTYEHRSRLVVDVFKKFEMIILAGDGGGVFPDWRTDTQEPP